MVRAGTAPEQQRAGGSQFAFQPGLGKITNATVAIETLGSWDAVGYRITVQRLNKEHKPTEDDEITQFLPLASVRTKDGDPLFQPGKASGDDDDSPEPLGEDSGTEGNCLCADNEELKVDKTMGGSIFSTSLAENGFPAKKLNGFAPNFIGVLAEFDQKELKKPVDGKGGITALIVKKILEMPKGVGKATGTGGGKATGTTNKAGTGTGAGKAAESKGSSAPAPSVDDETEGKAIQCLVKIGEGIVGQTVTRQKIGTKLLMTFSKVGVKPNQQAGIQALFANDAWFMEKCNEGGWTVDGDNVTVPALPPTE